MMSPSYLSRYILVASIAAIHLSFAMIVVRAQAVSAEAGILMGTVRDRSNAVIPGVKVSAFNIITDFHRETMTNASGKYSLADLPRGIYMLCAELPGFETVIGVQSVDEQSADWNFFLKPATLVSSAEPPRRITGTVRDFGYVSLPDAKVTFTNRAAGRTEQTVTDAMGNFSLPSVPDGPLEIVAEKAGYEPLRLKEVRPASSITTHIHLRLRKQAASR